MTANTDATLLERTEHQNKQNSPKVGAAPIKNLTADASVSGGDEVNLDVIMDIPVNFSVEIGRVKVPIKDLLQYNQGAVVELDRPVDEPLDVFVNGTLVAHGEVVVVNEKFGIRLTDVVSPSDRLKNLA